MWFVRIFVEIPCTLGKIYCCNMVDCVYVTCINIYCTKIFWCNIISCVYVTCSYSFFVENKVLVVSCIVGCMIVSCTFRIYCSVKYRVDCCTGKHVLFRYICTYCTYILHQNQPIVFKVLIHYSGCRHHEPEFEKYSESRSKARVALSMFRTTVAPDFTSGNNLTTWPELEIVCRRSPALSKRLMGIQRLCFCSSMECECIYAPAAGGGP